MCIRQIQSASKAELFHLGNDCLDVVGAVAFQTRPCMRQSMFAGTKHNYMKGISEKV